MPISLRRLFALSFLLAALGVLTPAASAAPVPAPVLQEDDGEVAEDATWETTIDGWFGAANAWSRADTTGNSTISTG